MEKRYLNLKDLCDYVGLKPKQVYWLVFRRRIPHGHLTLAKGNKSPLIFDKLEIDKWLRETSISFNDLKNL